jgi:methionine-rich copper-binding protein CopC
MKRFTLGILIIVTSMFIGIYPSSAHTSLISSQPKINGRVSGTLAEISLQFDEDLITLGDKDPNLIALLDSHGKSMSLGKTEVVGSIARASVVSSGMASGMYSVQYRVVSGDGHVVTSEYQFTYTANAESQESPSPRASVSQLSHQTETSTATSEPSVYPTRVTAEPNHEHSSFISRHNNHIIFTLAGLAFIGIWFLIRRRNN